MEKLADVISALRQQQTLINTAVTTLEQLYALSGTSQWPTALNGRNGRVPKLNSRGQPYKRGPHAPARALVAATGASPAASADARAEAKREYQREWRKKHAGKGKRRAAKAEPASDGGSEGTTYDYVLRALDDAAEPLIAADILKRAQAQGWETGSAEPINVISQALYVLTKKKTLKKFYGGGGQPAFWGYPKWQKAAQAANRLRREAAAAAG